MIPYVSVKTESPLDFYSAFELTEDDEERILVLFEEGYDLEATDLFVSEFMESASVKYQELMSYYLRYSEQGPMRSNDQDKLIRNISLLSLGLSTVLIKNFNTYLNNIYSNNIFNNAGIKDSKIKKSILNETLSEFDNLMSGTVSKTQSFILNSLRTFQREMIAENLLLTNSGITGAALENEIDRFKKSLFIKYPEVYKAMNKGNLLTTSKFKDGVEFTRHYKMDYYIDLVARTTLLNTDRISNTISALVDGEQVVEYYLSDNRKVKKDRELCQTILNNKVNGLSILALNQDTATKLGVMTYDEAKSTPDYAMGPLCRHSVRRCSKEYLESINYGN